MRAAMMSLALMLGLIVPLGGAAGQSSCEKKCRGNSSCLRQCAQPQKRAPQAKQQRQAPPAAADSSGWRERAFTTEGGAGGY